ncbi:MAG: hydantoinase/oxoprolinase family protein, partial [Thermoleophilia bacterium]|nr:hydantoinase/oxoprolinase family protein [Thermoleophilia bacterium]
EVLPEIREYERAVTTAVDAALTPVLRGYLRALADRASEFGVPEPEIMQSNGGLIDLPGAADHASRTVLSGPAAGVIGAAALGARFPMAITFDMGGTSCDVALVQAGRPGRTGGTVINGQPLHLPMLDVVTVSAGGGSIGWADSGAALRVGPRSAGARPGPAAYGHGGDRATVTDANVVLGRLPVDVTLGGDLHLDPVAAATVIDALADELGLSRDDCALGIIRVANQEMARAVRRVSVERGIDPRGAAVIAFGGAGPLHACEVAEEVGARRVIVPATAGMLAARGLLAAGQRRDAVHTVLLPTSAADDLRAETARLIAQVTAALPDARVTVSADCRYVGQRHSLTVEWPGGGHDTTLLEAAFHHAHHDRFGGSEPDHPVEMVSLRVAAERGATPLPIPERTTAAPVVGPAVCRMDGATVWVADGWRAHTTSDGGFDLEREA